MPEVPSYFTCLDCFPKAIEIGMIAPGYYLTHLIDDRWVIIGGQGHDGDILFAFHDMPITDPLAGLTDDEINSSKKEWGAYEKYLSTANKNTLTMDCLEAYNFITACLKSGLYSFERDGYNFNDFIFNHCGKMIRDFNSKKG